MPDKHHIELSDSSAKIERGAVDLDTCGTRRGSICHCEKCAACGWGKHMAIHGPSFGESPGTKPWGHEFVAASNFTEENL